MEHAVTSNGERRPPRKATAVFLVSLLFVGELLLSGCSTSMYSESRDTQGKALKATWAGADLKSQIEVPRKNRAAILAEQLSTEDALAKVTRDGLIRGVVTAAPGTRNPRPDDGTVAGQLVNLEALVKPGRVTGIELDRLQLDWAAQKASRQARVAKLRAWWQARKDATSAQRDYEDMRPEFERFALAMPACEGDVAGDAKARARLAAWIDKNGSKGQALKGTLALTDQACEALQTAQNATERNWPAGRLEEIRTRLSYEKNELSKLKAQKAAEREEVVNALAEGEEAKNKGNRERVMTATAKLKKNFDILIKAQDAFSVEFISAKKQESIDKFLAAVAETPDDKEPPVGSSKAALALILFPALFDDAKQEFAEANKLSLAPLVLQKSLAKIAQEAATRDLAARNARITLLQQQLDLLTKQADAYYELDVLATSMPDVTLKSPVAVMLASDSDKPVPGYSVTLDERIRVWKLFGKYIDAGTRLEAERKKVDYRLLALANEEQLTLAESNVAQWSTLIGANVDQMATFGASGIKAEQIISLVNSLSLLWIGSGVH